MLILTPLKDAAACLEGYCQRLVQLTYPHALISVGFLESDSMDSTVLDLQDHLPALRRAFKHVGFWKRDFGFHIPRGIPRWAPAIQLERRAVLAKSRNHLLFHALRDHAWVLWLDVDLVEYPPDLLERLLATGKDIVQPHCVLEYGGPTFDLNGWRDHGRLHLDDLRPEGELVELDAVGGTVLLVRADVHRDGLIFPTFPYGRGNPRIRTGHRPGGPDGELETEGLGIMARDMGYACWGMPHLEILHRSGRENHPTVAPAAPGAAPDRVEHRSAGVRALHVRGPFRGPTGYDHHVREFVRELDRQGVAVQLTDLPAWGPTRLPANLRDPWFEMLGRPTDARTVLHFCMPHQVQADRQRLNVNYTMFEATRIPAAWVAAQRHHDLVIVPTESSRQAWLDSGVPASKLRACPLGINPHLFGGSVEPWPLYLVGGTPATAYPVRFLNVSTLIPRKNLLGLLRVWLRATSAADGAVLLLKLGAHPPVDWARFEAELRRLEAELGKGLDQAAPVHLVEGFLSDAQMPRLYAAVTHYISLSHGEGWDQPMLEAAASGLGLIAPDHSAYVAHLDASTARLVPSRLVPADVGGLFAGAAWWAPDEDAAVEHVRAAIAGGEGSPCSPRARILAEFTWQRATRRLLGILEELEASRPRRSWPGLRWNKPA